MRRGTTRRGALVGLAGAAAAVAGARVVGAADGAGGPAWFVGDFADRVLATLRDGSLGREERLRRVDAQMADGFALDRIARVALGRYWKTADEAQRREFGALFKAYVLASYARRFDGYADRKLRVVGAAPAGEGTLVESYLEGGAAPVRLDWRVAPAGDGWRVLDVVVEGVSLLVTYRGEFAAVIERSGGRLSGLIGELRARVAAERAPIAG